MSKIALFPGSFDPFTNGHLNTVKRASVLFEQVIIGIFINTSKTSLFTPQEKKVMVEAAILQAGLSNVKVILQEPKLSVELARDLGAGFLVRGIRNVKDYEYERDIQQLNNDLAAEIETVFFFSDPKFSHTSSSMIKEIFHFGGDISPYVPQEVLKQMKAKRQNNEI